MTSEEYHEWTRTDEWIELRDRLVADKPRQCFKCTLKGCSLDAHHLRYPDGHPRNTRAEDLVLLCRECHDLVEDAKKKQVIPYFHTGADIKALSYRIAFTKQKPRPKSVFIPSGFSSGINRMELMKTLNTLPEKCRLAVAKCMGVFPREDMTFFADSKWLIQKIIQVNNIVLAWQGKPVTRKGKSKKASRPKPTGPKFNREWRKGNT